MVATTTEHNPSVPPPELNGFDRDIPQCCFRGIAGCFFAGWKIPLLKEAPNIPGGLSRLRCQMSVGLLSNVR